MSVRANSIVYYIDQDRVRSGHLVAITKPDEEEKKLGAKPLYEFGHGFSTPEVFKTEEEAQSEIAKKSTKS